jgi:hypothetical protein
VVLWASEALSLIGDRIIMVALVTLVYDRTGSAGAVGLLVERLNVTIVMGGIGALALAIAVSVAAYYRHTLNERSTENALH